MQEKAVPFDAISEEELAHRREAVRFARANCELEGLSMSDEHKPLFDSYTNGEISLEEFGIARQGMSRTSDVDGRKDA
jgi:hypothetical protein